MVRRDAEILITEIKKKWNRITYSEQLTLRDVEGCLARGETVINPKLSAQLEAIYRGVQDGRGYANRENIS